MIITFEVDEIDSYAYMGIYVHVYDIYVYIMINNGIKYWLGSHPSNVFKLIKL